MVNGIKHAITMLHQLGPRQKKKLSRSLKTIDCNIPCQTKIRLWHSITMTISWLTTFLFNVKRNMLFFYVVIVACCSVKVYNNKKKRFSKVGLEPTFQLPSPMKYSNM